MFSIEIDYPDYESELQIVRTTTSRRKVSLQPVCSREEIESFRTMVWNIPVAESIMAAAVALVRATRPNDPSCPDTIKSLLTWGAGPRASQYLILAAKAYAILENRPTPDISDIRSAAYPVLRHRLVRSFHAEVDNISQNRIIEILLEAIVK